MQIAVFAKECHARARIRVCLVQLYARSLMRMAGRYYRHKAWYKRFYYPAVVVGKALTINNLHIFASLFVNYTVRHSLYYSDLRDIHRRETTVLKHVTRLKRTVIARYFGNFLMKLNIIDGICAHNLIQKTHEHKIKGFLNDSSALA